MDPIPPGSCSNPAQGTVEASPLKGCAVTHSKPLGEIRAVSDATPAAAPLWGRGSAAAATCDPIDRR